MDDLIAALQIFRKYKNEQWPTMCSHNELGIVGITLEEVSKEDRLTLDKLGFLWSPVNDCWMSFRFGSA